MPHGPMKQQIALCNMLKILKMNLLSEWSLKKLYSITKLSDYNKVCFK